MSFLSEEGNFRPPWSRFFTTPLRRIFQIR
jgi:hypothetical protein